MKTLELQHMFIDRVPENDIEVGLFKKLKAVINNPIYFVRVLLSNHGWCIEKEIYTPHELLMCEPEILHKAGLALPEYSPVDFERTTTIGDIDWLPLNEGATLNKLNGDYIDFDTANKDCQLPTNIELQLLAAASNQFGLYEGTFGRVFHGDNNNLFLPSAGYRHWYDGSLYNDGGQGHYWSSSVSDANGGWDLYFNSGGINPEYGYYRSNGLSVRCIKK